MSILLAVAVLFALAFLENYRRHRNEVKRVQHIPGVAYLNWPIYLLFSGDLNFLLKGSKGLSPLVKKYGPVFRITIGWETFVYVADHQLNKEVLVTKDKHFRKGPLVESSVNIVSDENNIIASHGEVWRKHRMALNPSFSDSGLKDIYNSFIIPCCDTVLHSWDNKIGSQDKIDINMSVALGNFVSDLFGQAAMGYKFENKQDELSYMYKMCKRVNLAMITLAIVPKYMVTYLPFYPFSDVKKTIKEWRAFLQECISKKTNEQENSDLLSVMLRHRASTIDETEKLNDEEILSNLHMLMIAGNDTTIHTMEWIMYYLARNPTVQEKARLEVETVCGGTDTVTYEQIHENFPYLNAIIKEALRMKMPASHIFRYSKNDVTIGDALIPKNVTVVPLFGHMSREENYWGEDTSEFKPERFLEKSDSEIRYRTTPFSAGPRACIGKKLANTEMLTFLIQTLKKYRVSVRDGESTSDWMPEKMMATMSTAEEVKVCISKI
jgi:cytochrome P450